MNCIVHKALRLSKTMLTFIR